ncbi:MAG: hypothetical protein IGS38_00515 [Synechococcales cyanobacterium M58_A2018_015]|nr:hypothetical protein [Synechococcales cyanobacterium M58_A2018_015]
MKWQWRLFWGVGLILLWLLCSGGAWAGPVSQDPLSQRLAQYPHWQGKPPVQPARGDLIYPDWFAGNWQVTTTLVDLQAPLAPEKVTPGFESNRQFLNQPVAFRVRFVQAPVQSWLTAIVPQKGVVSDRAFNGTSLAKAYLGEQAVRAVKVDPRNPNRQITLLKNNRQLVSTVTDRATAAPTADQFLSSEFFRQEFRGAPQIYFNEVENTTAYTYHPDAEQPTQPAITADQITAVYLSPQDPDYFKTLSSDHPFAEPRPVALYRYRLEFFKLATSDDSNEAATR